VNSRKINKNETVQENVVKQFLREHNIAFEQNKRILGYGRKRWIVDFYLPEYDIILEVKIMDSKDSHVFYDRIYKDLYKLDELGERYNLRKVLLINGAFLECLSESFIPNLNAHGIYFITRIDQIIPIIQGIKIERNNLRRFRERKRKLQEAQEAKRKELETKRKKFKDKHFQILWQWAIEGKSCSKMDIHPQTLNRIVRKFVKNSLEEHSPEKDIG